MPKYSTKMRRALRELADVAYERELRVAVSHLADFFTQWQAGQVNTWDLVYRLHRFHYGPDRDLYKHYSWGPPDLVVAQAVVTGVLKESEVPPRVLAALDHAITFYRALNDPERKNSRNRSNRKGNG